MIISTNSQKYASNTYLNDIWSNNYILSTIIANIKNYYLHNKEELKKITLSFTISHKTTTQNSMDQALYRYAIQSNTSLNNISTVSIENTTQHNQYNSDAIIEGVEEDVSYETAYHLLLSLLNNDISLVEEALSIAMILVKEGVLVAPCSKIKNNISKIMPYIQKQKTQNLANSR